MMRASAVGLVAALGMTLLKEQIFAIYTDPDVLARVAIAPLEQQSALIFVKAPHPIQEIAVKAVEDGAYLALIHHLGGAGLHLGGGASRQVFFGDGQAAR